MPIRLLASYQLITCKLCWIILLPNMWAVHRILLVQLSSLLIPLSGIQGPISLCERYIQYPSHTQWYIWSLIPGSSVPQSQTVHLKKPCFQASIQQQSLILQPKVMASPQKNVQQGCTLWESETHGSQQQPKGSIESVRQPLEWPSYSVQHTYSGPPAELPSLPLKASEQLPFVILPQE